jgi:hypothetical protein
MVGDKYIVIKDIPKGHECIAKVGDVLIEKEWERCPALMKEDKAVCDPDSFYGKEYCKLII